MNPIFKRALSGVTAIGLGAALVPFLGVTPAGAAVGDQGAPVITPSPVAENTTNFAFTDPSGEARCEGSGGQGYRVRTFIADQGTDISTLQFNQAGFPQTEIGDDRDSTDGTIASGLWKGEDPPGNINPAASPVGLINPADLGGFNFADPGWNIAPGAYEIGFACVWENADNPNRNPETWWSQTVTINGGGGSFMVEGAVDEAPTLDSVTPGDTTLTADFTHTPSDADNTTYTATATPTGGGAAVTETGTTSPITIGGLTNGTEYSVTVRATNLAGDSVESNAITGTPVPGAQPAVENLAATPDPTPDSGIVNLDWDAPVGGESTPTGYEVTVDPAGGTVTVDDVNTSAQVTGLAPGTPYTFTVTPLHDSPYVGTPASVEATPVASGVTVLEQNVTVTRPAGALVFTQICEDSSTGTPLAGATFGTDPCAILFGVAERILDPADPRHGRYFEASASLNNVQVDSNGDDTGWTVTGDMSEFIHSAHASDPTVAPANMRFSGDQLGWTPLEVSKTDGLVVNLGDPVAPEDDAPGMSDNPTLASSPTPGSLGIAELDANLDLLIPVQKRAGEYQGTLTMTATPGA